jgi:phosphatidylglycerol:prolipoprotein diacylglycerol transferase
MTLFKIFGLAVHGYGLMLAIAFLVAIFGVGRIAKREGISFDNIIDLAIWVIIGAVVGARIVYVFSEYRYFLSSPWYTVFLVNWGGLVFYGGLIGGFLAGFWYVLRKKLHPWKLADMVAPFIALGYSIVRIGCLMNGCCYGTLTNVPWALRCAAGDTALRHPTQIYSMLGSLIIFFILLRFRRHKQFAGFLFLLYVGLYSIMRFIVEIFREAPRIFPWLSIMQLVCIISAIVAFGLIWLVKHLERRTKLDATSEVQH